MTQIMFETFQELYPLSLECVTQIMFETPQEPYPPSRSA